MKGIVIALIVVLLGCGTAFAQSQVLRPIEKGKCVLSYANGKDSLVCFYNNWKLEGQWTEYYPDGNTRLVKAYKQGYPLGLMQYYPDGNIKRKETYSAEKFGLITEGHLYDTEGKEVDFVPYMELPQFPGGNEMLATVLAKCIKYPKEAVEKGIQGIVTFRCKIDESGKPVSLKMVRGVTPILDKEAERVVAYLMTMYTFTPGKKEGQPVKMDMYIPVRFRL